MNPILTVTLNPTIDVGIEIESLRSTGKCRATVGDVAAGGGGINVARVIVELGGRAVALHTSGAELGRRLDRLLDEETIEHVAVDIAGETREAFVLHETSTGQSYHVVPPGPEVSADEVDAVFDTMTRRATRDGVVVVSGSLPPGLPGELLARFAETVAAVGARLVLDPSGTELPTSLGPGAHLLKLNRREAGRIIGTEVHGFDDARRANEHVLDHEWAVLAATTVGEHGAVVSTRTTHHEIHTPQLPGPALSDAGAGDGFTAGLTLGLVQGLGADDAGALAVATASASVLTPGTEHCRRDDVERLRPGVHVVRRDRSAAGRAAGSRRMVTSGARRSGGSRP